MDICFALSDVNWSFTKDFFSVVSSLASACGVVAAIIFGVVGLSTWRRQAKGSNDHELSRRILLGVYRYRESIGRVRYPTLKKHELQFEPEKKEQVDHEITRFRRLAKAYEQRLDDVLARR